MAGADINNFSTPGPDGMRHAAGGWYHFFHIDDIRAIAPRWLHYEVPARRAHCSWGWKWGVSFSRAR